MLCMAIDCFRWNYYWSIYKQKVVVLCVFISLSWCTEKTKTTIFIRLIIVYIIVYTIFNLLWDQEVHDWVQNITYGTLTFVPNPRTFNQSEVIVKYAQDSERANEFAGFDLAQIQMKLHWFVFIEVKIICITRVAQFD